MSPRQATLAGRLRGPQRSPYGRSHLTETRLDATGVATYDRIAVDAGRGITPTLRQVLLKSDKTTSSTSDRLPDSRSTAPRRLELGRPAAPCRHSEVATSSAPADRRQEARHRWSCPLTSGRTSAKRDHEGHCVFSTFFGQAMRSEPPLLGHRTFWETRRIGKPSLASRQRHMSPSIEKAHRCNSHSHSREKCRWQIRSTATSVHRPSRPASGSDRAPTDIRIDEVNRPIQLWAEARFSLIRLYEAAD